MVLFCLLGTIPIILAATPPVDSGIPMPGPSTPDYSPLVVLDPGHPSEVAAGDGLQNGLREVQVNWDISQLLAAELAKRGVCRTFLTRHTFSEMTTNRRRAEIANEAKAALMVRLHCDSAKGEGFTLYYPDATGTHDGVTGPSPEVMAGSREAARACQAAAETILPPMLKVNPVKTDRQTAIGSKQGALIGSIHSKVPVVTVEMVYLNNPADARVIGSPDGQKRMVQALAQGITDFLSSRKQANSPMKEGNDQAR